MRKNVQWEKQIAVLPRVFTALTWWKLAPLDMLVQSSTPRGMDRRELNQIAPPRSTYWCLAETGRTYLVYDMRDGVTISIEDALGADLTARQIDLRTGAETTPPVNQRRTESRTARQTMETGC